MSQSILKRLFAGAALVLAAASAHAQAVQELIVPKYFVSKQAGSTNTQRVPFSALVKFTGLTANTLYDLRVGVGIPATAATATGAGNVTSPSPILGYSGGALTGTNTAQPNLAAGAANLENLFVTDATGASPALWLIVQPTGNANNFGGGISHNLRYYLQADPTGSTALPGGGGTFPGTLVGSSTLVALDAQTTATVATTDDAAYITATLPTSALNSTFVVGYDAVTGGNMLFTTQVNPNSNGNTANYTNLPTGPQTILAATGSSNTAQFTGPIPIGANNTNGLRRLEFYNVAGTLLASTTSSTGFAGTLYGTGTAASTTSATRLQTVALPSSQFSNLVAPEPTTAASSLTLASSTNASLSLSWTNGNGDHRIVIASASPITASNLPVDQTDYTASAVFGNGTASTIGGAQVIYNGTGNTVNLTGLTGSSTYYFAVFEANGAGTITNYRTATYPSNNFATQANPGSIASDIIANGGTTNNIAYASFQATTISSTANAVQVAGFTLRDGGASGNDADAYGTNLSSITFSKGASNTVSSWANTIRTAALVVNGVVVATTPVTAETITFSGLTFAAADDATQNFELYLTFETTVTDNQQFQFRVLNSDVTTTGSTSGFASFTAVSTTTSGDANRIEVTADRLSTSAASSYNKNSAFALNVNASDVNGNKDADYTGTVNLTATGATLAPASMAAVAGTATFNNQTFTTTGTGVTFGFTGAGIAGNFTSSSFNVALSNLEEVIFPQYITAKGDSINATSGPTLPRTNYAFVVRINNLTPGGAYKFTIGADSFVNNTSAGAGNFVLFGHSAGITNNGTLAPVAYTADANGSVLLYGAIQPTTNARFRPNAKVYLRVGVSTAGGSAVAVRYTSTLYATALDVLPLNANYAGGATISTLDDGAYVDAYINPSNAGKFAFVYDNAAGTGRPLNGNIVENNTLGDATTGFYNNINTKNGRVGFTVPTTLANGLRLVQTVDTFGTAAVALSSTNGTFGTYNTVNTVNPTRASVTCLGLDFATAITAGAATHCQGSPATLNVTNATSDFTFKLKRNGITIGTTGNNPTFAGLDTTGNYTVLISNGNCSFETAPLTITVNPVPVASFTTGGPLTFCAGNSVVLTSTSTGNTSQQWLMNGSPIGGATGTTYTATMSGTYSLTASTATCSATSSTVTITVNPNPVASFTAGGPKTFCAGNSVVFTSTSTGTTAQQWLMNGNAINGATGTTYTATMAGSYQVAVTNGNCVDTSAAQNVIVNPNPVASFTVGGPTTFCSGGSVMFTSTSTGNTLQQWTLNGAAIAGAAGTTYTATQTGVYRLIAYSGTCTDTSAATMVNELALPDSTLTSATGSLCGASASGVTLSAVQATGNTYQFYKNGTLIPGATSSTYNATTTGSYTVLVTNASGCASTSDALVLTNGSAPFPYAEKFENGNGGWTAGGVNSSWALGTPAKGVIQGAASGSNAFVTKLTGNYNNNERSYVESPCFDFSGVPDAAGRVPFISMNIWWSSEASRDGASLQYTTNNGATWTTIGAVGDLENWYTANLTTSPARAAWTGSGTTGNQAHGSNGYVFAQHELPAALYGQANVRLRIYFTSDNSVAQDGFAFDDVFMGYQVPTTTSLRSNDCSNGIPYALAGPTSYVLANSLASTFVQGYEFVFTPTNSALPTRTRRTTTYRIDLPTLGLSYGTTYDVSVRGFRSGIKTPMGATCQVVTIQSPVTVPPVTNIRSGDCGRFNFTTTGYIGADLVNGRPLYTFRFTNTANNQATILTSNSRFVTLTGLTYGATYNVAVKATVDGVSGAFSTSPCQIGLVTTATPPATKVRTGDCGKTRAANGYIGADYVAGANSYTFKVYSDAAATQLVSSVTQTQYYLQLAPLGLTAGSTYYVTVQATYGGNTGLVGDTCAVIIRAATPRTMGTSEAITVGAYPNPFSGTATLSVGQADMNENASYTYEIVDLAGRILQAPTRITGSSTQIGASLQAGTYLVRVYANGNAVAQMPIVKAN